MNQNLFQVAIIGFGRTGAAHARAWNALEGARAVAVVDDSAAARQRAEELGLHAFEDLNALVRSSVRIDAASLCTPTAFHETQAASLLSAGIPVLCETPAASTARGAQFMMSAATAKAPLQTTSKFRHLPEVRKARALLAHGVIGDLVLFHGDLSQPEDMSERWNSVPEFSGGGVMMAQGCEAADLIRFLISPVAKAQSVPVQPVQDLAVEDSAIVLFTTECGVSGNVTLSWSLFNNSGVYFSIHGTKGSLDLGYQESWLRVDGEAPVRIAGESCIASAYRRMVTNFRELCLTGEDQWIAPSDIIASAAVMESAYKSLQTGRWSRVTVAQPMPASAASRAYPAAQAAAACS
ncbi:NADH-dependent dehydrogenase [Bryobacterales bacterium F-183]|nr:NADH-dependent dehydrogenase [Bryobacterales bacterium F-183]